MRSGMKVNRIEPLVPDAQALAGRCEIERAVPVAIFGEQRCDPHPRSQVAPPERLERSATTGWAGAAFHEAHLRALLR